MKKHVSDFLELVECVYKDASAKCIADVSDLRDLETIRSRVENEGLSFLTLTLPKFCKDLERGLAMGFVDATLFARWKRARGAVMPAFLQGFTRHIFDFETGKVTSNEYTSEDRGASNDIPTIIESVRQLCLTFKKVEMECRPERVDAAFENYIKVEQTLQSSSVPTEDKAKFLAVSSLLWDNLVSDFQVTKCVPRHGPGATADKISGNQKFRWKYWYDRLEPYFPLIDNAYPLGTPEDAEELKLVTIVSRDDELPVRVIGVPKTLKGPRIIAIEPCCMQYVQQGIRDYLYKKLESYWLTAGHVNFTDQKVNQQLAMRSSKDGQLATIDLSDASDRVPRDLALEMFRGNQDLYDSIEACRSTTAQLPDGTLVGPLNKFASMGSALCFPVEAMYFYTICVMALLDGKSLSYTQRNIQKVSRRVYVYGDDIIVPVAYATIVLDYLQKYHCKVNVDKTFYTGKFRESCGVDAYDGHEVTPVYVRQLAPENKRQASSLISWIATRNLFYLKGYWRTARLMQDRISRVIENIPYVADNSEGLGYVSFLGFRSVGRWNGDLQRFEVKTVVAKASRRADEIDGYSALMKCLHSLEGRLSGDLEPDQGWRRRKPSLDPALKRSLTHSALRGAVALKLRWVAA